MAKKKSSDLLKFILLLGIIAVLNLIVSIRFFRIDLTSEKRYSLSDATLELLESFDDFIQVKIYLEGDFPAEFQRLQRETVQMLDEFRAYNPNIQYELIDPNGSEDEQINKEVNQQLQFKGLKAYRLDINKKGGKESVDIYPGAILNYGDKEIAVPLLQDQFNVSPETQVNNSIQNLEYALASAIKALVVQNKPLVGFLQGHGELDVRYVTDFAKTLSQNYRIDLFNIREFRSDSTGQQLSVTDQQRRLNKFDAMIIAKPQKGFNDLDKYLLDQYLMTGGKVLWLIDAIHADMDSLSKSAQFMSFPIYDRLNLSDFLFGYGVRINTNITRDVVAAGVSDQRAVYPWIYFPLVLPQVDHPIAKNLNAIKLEFPSSIDTIIARGIDKTILLKTSPYSDAVFTPFIVNLASLYEEQDPRRYTKGNIPLGILLEGEFESVFKNRIVPRSGSGEQLQLVEKSVPTQMLVVSDGDIIKNQLNILNPNIPKGTPLPLGFDQFTGAQYGNSDFLINTVDYMLDESGLISIRSRELKLRMLDRVRANESRALWQIVNTAIPIGVIVLFGLVFNFIRRRKYSKR